MSHEPESTAVALCTTPVPEAESLVDALLRERLIACANLVGPVRSRYRWQGALEESQEMLLVLKLRSELAPRLQQRILELHSYDCPEVLVFHADAGLPDYLAWVRDEADGAG